jgi:hypothetical protein
MVQRFAALHKGLCGMLFHIVIDAIQITQRGATMTVPAGVE